MADLLQALYTALNWFLAQIYKLATWLLDGFLYVIKAVLWLILSGILTAVQSVFDAINFGQVTFQWAAAYTNIPAQAVYVMTAVGFPTFLTMIAGAYAIRLALNLIPSWATRA